MTRNAAKAVSNPNRPRLRTESERRLAKLEENCAASYTEVETVTEDLKKLAKTIDDSDASIPLPVDSWEDKSLIHHMEELHERAKTEE